MKKKLMVVLLAICLGISVTASAQYYLWWDIVGFQGALVDIFDVGLAIEALNIAFGAGGGWSYYTP